MTIHALVSQVQAQAALFNSEQAGKILAQNGFSPAFSIASLAARDAEAAVSANHIYNGVPSTDKFLG